MKSLFIVGLLVALALTVVNADDAVLVLTDANFDEQVTKHEVLLIEFYAPWCGHCKRLEPEYAAAANILAKDDPPIYIAKVDCTSVGKSSCQKNGVKGYPTLKLFKHGHEVAKYKNERTSDAIIKYMRSKAGPVSKSLETVEDVETFTNKLDPVVVGFFKTEESDSFGAFYGLAGMKSEDFRFGHSSNEDVLKKYKKFTDKIVIFRPAVMKNKFEEEHAVHESGDLNEWFKKNIFGLAGVRTQANSAYFPTPLVTAYFKVDYERDPKGTQYWRNRVMKVAKDFKNKFTFAVARASDFAGELAEFGASDVKGDVRVTLKNEKGQKFPMRETFSMDTFRAFLQSYIDGGLEPYLKSEAVPEDNSGPVKVLVAKNFDEIVNDKTKDVLIEFYAPWCGHCKSLEPKYLELGEKLKDEENIVIAKMDATANDVPAPYHVKGFPTLYFAPKDGKDSPKQYSGGREVADFIQYLAKETSLKGFDKKGNKKDEL